MFAHFDGGGASGAFRPCVSYYTQDGKLFARAFPADDLAAGESADVSYFPGLSQSPAGAGISDVASPGATVTVTNPTGPTVDLDLPAYTNGADAFTATTQTVATATPTHISYSDTPIAPNGWFEQHASGGTTFVRCATPGLYIIQVGVVCFTVDTAAGISVSAQNTVNPTATFGNSVAFTGPMGAAGFGTFAIYFQFVGWFSLHAILDVEVLQTHGSNVQVSSQMFVMKII